MNNDQLKISSSYQLFKQKYGEKTTFKDYMAASKEESLGFYQDFKRHFDNQNWQVLEILQYRNYVHTMNRIIHNEPICFQSVMGLVLSAPRGKKKLEDIGWDFDNPPEVTEQMNEAIANKRPF